MKIAAMSSLHLTSASESQQQSCALPDCNLSIEACACVSAHERSEWALLGDSVAVRQLRSQIRRVAPYFRTALIRGEAGAGKEQVARAIHALSPASESRFVVADAHMLAESNHHCESSDANLVPTLARVLESAHRGTLYLTHLDNLSFAQQAGLFKRLRVCEERRSIWPHPGSGTIGGLPNTRILAASDRDLRSLAAIGQFRQDLYARLSGLEIFVPPLRQRVADVPILCECLLRGIAERNREPTKSLTESAMLWLQQYSWPKNLSELEYVILQVAKFTEGQSIEAGQLMALVQPEDAGVPISSTLKIEPLHDVIQRHVLETLNRCGGNKVRAAEALGISRSTLYRMLGVRAVSGNCTGNED